jgi:hypothetical protein
MAFFSIQINLYNKEKHHRYFLTFCHVFDKVIFDEVIIYLFFDHLYCFRPSDI